MKKIAVIGIIIAVIGIIITISGIKVFDITLSEWEWPKNYWPGKSPTKVEYVRGEPKDSKRTVPTKNREGKVAKLSVSEVRISLKPMSYDQDLRKSHRQKGIGSLNFRYSPVT